MRTILSTIALTALSYAYEFQGCALKQLPTGASGNVGLYDRKDQNTGGNVVSLVARLEGLDNGSEHELYMVEFTGYNDFLQSDIDGLNSGALTCEDLHANDEGHSEHAIHAGFMSTNDSGDG